MPHNKHLGEHRWSFRGAEVTEYVGHAVTKYEIEGSAEERERVVDYLMTGFPSDGYGTTVTYEGNDLTRMQRGTRL